MGGETELCFNLIWGITCSSTLGLAKPLFKRDEKKTKLWHGGQTKQHSHVTPKHSFLSLANLKHSLKRGSREREREE